jgi:periplasmic mercuric ion binding protein
MKSFRFLALPAALAVLAVLTAAADTPATPTPFTVTITDAHVCCGKCVAGAAKAVSSLTGVTAIASEDDSDVVVTAPDKATAQKAVDALTNAGYWGKSSDATIKVSTDTGATSATVTSLDVSNVHLCCGSCVKAVKAALGKVPGVTACNPTTGAKTFTVTGTFKPTDVFAALNGIGLTGKEVATKQ